MANDLVIKLLLKTGAFSTDLKVAKGQIQNFQSGCQTAGKSLTNFASGLGINVTALTKFAGVAGGALAAAKALKGIIDSTQTTSDAFTNAMAGAKGIVDQFASSLATCDFSRFKNGLWDVFDAAKRASEAIDALNDATVANNYFQSKYSSQFNKQYEIFKNPDSTPEQKEDAKKKMEEIIGLSEQDAKNYAQKLMNAYKATVIANTKMPIESRKVTMSLFEEFLSMKLSPDVDSLEKNVKEQYDALNKAYKKYDDKNKGNQYINQYDNARKALLYSMFKTFKDKDVKDITDMLDAYNKSQDSATAMRTRLDRISKPDSGSSSSRGGSSRASKKDEIELQAGSIAKLKEELSAAQKQLDALKGGTEEWQAQKKVVDDLTEQLKAEEDVLKKLNGETPKVNYQVGSLTELKTQISEAEKMRDSIAFGTEEWEKQDKVVKELTDRLKIMEMLIKYGTRDSLLDELMSAAPDLTINQYEQIISLLKEMRDELPVTSEDFAEFNQMIEDFSNKLDKVKGIGLPAPQTDKWKDFNSTMAETSTIVSNLASCFQNSSKSSAQAILQMVSTALPAIGSLISAIAALTAAKTAEAGAEGVSKAVSSSKNWIEAVAAVTAIAAAIAGAIGTIKNASKQGASNYANGGIVGGSSFTGDRVAANVNSGEMILNRGQQYNLWKQINNGEGGGNQVTFRISGSDLVGTLDNYSRKSKSIR